MRCLSKGHSCCLIKQKLNKTTTIATIIKNNNLYNNKNINNNIKRHFSLNQLLNNLNDNNQLLNNEFYLMRSLLYVPGNSEKMLNKINQIKTLPDVFIPDLEDSVPYHQKEEARKLVKEFLLSNFTKNNTKNNENCNENCNENKMIIMPRVNSENEFLEKDLKSITLPNIVKVINIVKTATIDDVLKVNKILLEIETLQNLPKYTYKLIPSIESAIGLINVYNICNCLPQRIIAIAFGGDDYANDMGFTRNTKQSVEKELDFVRNTIAVAARASNIPSLDTPNVNFKDLNHLKEECLGVRQIGMKGKFAIHPNQIEIINSVFGPSEKEIEEAKEIVETYEKNARELNRGSCEVNGRMVDMPVYRRYKQVLMIADRMKGGI